MLAGDLDRAGGRPGGGVEAGVDADLAGGPGCGVVGVVIDRERVGRIVVGGPLGGVLRRRRLAGDAAQAVELIAGDEVGTATRRRDPIGREVAEVARVGRVNVADRLGGRIGCGVPGGVGEVPPRGGFGVSPCCLTGARCSCGAASVARPPRVEFEGSETVSGDRRVSLGFGEPYTDECACPALQFPTPFASPFPTCPDSFATSAPGGRGGRHWSGVAAPVPPSPAAPRAAASAAPGTRWTR